MKRNLLLCTLLSTMFLSSCIEGANSPINSETSPEEPSTPTELVESSTTQESSEESSSSEEPSIYDLVDQEFSKDESLLTIDTVELAVNETYNLSYMLKEQFKGSDCLVACQTEGIIESADTQSIKGLALGTSKVKVVSQGVYDELTVHVKDDEYMNSHFSTDLGRLAKKSFVVLGDSISDVSVSAYTDKQDFWCEQLVRKADMTMYNYAISGSTTGRCHKQVTNIGSYALEIMGTTRIQNGLVKADIKKSDFVFIYFGNNDFTFKTELGEIGDIDGTTYWTNESFRGAYSFILNKIKSYNPNCRVVCLGLSTSTWNYDNLIQTENYAKTRAELSLVVGEIAEATNNKFINLHGLWTTSEMETYCLDGIHPLTAGYDLIVEKILKS